MKRENIVLFLILLILSGSLYFYKVSNYKFVTVRFSDLRPFHNSLPVYYKGIIVGRAIDKGHSSDYTNTIVKIVLYPKNLKLPLNTSVVLKKEKFRHHEKDFLELIYPEKPSEYFVTDGAELAGKTLIDTEDYMANQTAEELEQIKENLLKSSESLNTALMQVADLFVLLQDVINENKSNLNVASSNLAKTTDNVKDVSEKFNTAIEQESLNNTFNNIEETTNSIKELSQNFNGTSQSVNDSMPKLTSTISDTQCTMNNINAITCGIRQTLSKPFGGLRLLFGKTIKQ